jgi:hypothetical protein
VPVKETYPEGPFTMPHMAEMRKVAQRGTAEHDDCPRLNAPFPPRYTKKKRYKLKKQTNIFFK